MADSETKKIIINISSNLDGTKSKAPIANILATLDKGDYVAARNQLIRLNEDVRTKVYEDTNKDGLLTVGIGFNMEAAGASTAWSNAFANTLNAPSFNDVMAGKVELSDPQIDTLFNYTVQDRENRLFGENGIYGSIMHNMDDNQRLTILDAFFTNEKIVGKNSSFFKAMQEYSEAVDDGDIDGAWGSLFEAEHELLDRSNKSLDHGLANRRLKEAAIFGRDVNVEQSSEMMGRLIESAGQKVYNKKASEVNVDGNEVIFEPSGNGYSITVPLSHTISGEYDTFIENFADDGTLWYSKELPNGQILLNEILPDGSTISKTLSVDAGLHFKMLSEEHYYTRSDVSVIKNYKEFDAFGHPVDEPTIDVKFTDRRVTAEQVGSVFGSLLGNHLANGDVFAKIALDTVFDTTLRTIGKTFDRYGVDLSFAGIGHGPLSLSQAFDTALTQSGDIALQNLKGSGIGVIASLLTADLMRALHLNGLPGQVASSLANEAFSTVLNNVITNGGLEGWSKGLTDIGNVGSAMGSLFGNYLASEIHQPTTEIGQIGATIGSTIGAYVGSVIPVIGTAIGSFLGNLIGGFIGDAIAPDRHPQAGAIVHFDPVSQSFIIAGLWRIDKGSTEAAKAIAQASIDSFNGILQAVGGNVLNPETIRGGSYGHSEKQVAYWLSDARGGDSYTFGSPKDLISYGVMTGLKDVQIAGGDVFAKRAFYETMRELNIGDGVSITNYRTQTHSLFDNILQKLVDTLEYHKLPIYGGLDAMMGNLSLAMEYRQYLENSAAINTLIAANPSSAFAAGWIITLAQASQLGLDRRHAEDWYGGWQANLTEHKLDANTMLFSLQGHERVISTETQDGGIERAQRDSVTAAAKDAFLGKGDMTRLEIHGSTVTVMDGFSGPISVGDKVAIAPHVTGGDGADFISGGDQGADLVGGGGNDTLVGGVLDDWLFGGEGNDILAAGGGSGNYLSGDAGNDTLVGAEGSDWLAGGEGDDTLFGAADDDILSGGAGRDTLDGGSGSDTYLYALGDGIDSIKDTGTSGLDVLRLKDSKNGEFTVYTSSSDNGLLLAAGDPAEGNWVVLENAASGGAQSIEQLITADGASLTLAELQRMARPSLSSGAALVGTAADETLTGTAFDDTLGGKGGTDALIGGFGSDRYVFTAGSKLTVTDTGFAQDVDTVEVDASLALSAMKLFRGSYDSGEMTLNFGAAGGTLTVNAIDQEGASTIEEIHFADGSSLTSRDIMNRYLAPLNTAGNNIIQGFHTADTLHGGDGNDTLTGGAGDDILLGEGGNDTYIYNVGDGNDTLNDYAGFDNTDRIIFGAGITPDEIRISRAKERPEDGIITFANHAGSIRATHLFYYGIEEFRFADGTVWNVDAIEKNYLLRVTSDGNDTLYAHATRGTALKGLAGNDSLFGGEGNDTFTGGAGDDTMSGSYGNDTFIYNIGDGNDTVEDYAGFDTTDRIIFGAGITPSEIRIARAKESSEDAFITFADHAGSIRIGNLFYHGIEEFRFADGTVWNADAIEKNYLLHVATEGSDALYAHSSNGTVLNGLAGNDKMLGGEGADTFTGGTGDDAMEGSYGNDTYIYNAGDGNDMVEDSVGYNDTDRLIFGAGITPSEIRIARFGEMPEDALITFADHAGSIRIGNLFYHSIEEFRFADGTVWNTDAIEKNYLLHVVTAGNDTLYAHTTNSTVVDGGAGDDNIFGGEGSDTFTGGTGNDSIYGGNGNDTYNYNVGDGDDLLKDNSGFNDTDRLVFGAGIVPSEIRIVREAQESDGFITFATHAGSIRVNSLFYHAIEEFRFADGTVWKEKEILGATHAIKTTTGTDKNDTLNGTAADDMLVGGYGDDALRGGLGNDILTGHSDSDSYYFNLGDGHDVVEDMWGSASTSDRVVFGAGITASGITLSQDAHNQGDILLSINANDSVLLKNFGAYGVIESFQFADGTVWNSTELLNRLYLAEKPTNDLLIGFHANDRILGGAGDDTLYSDYGDDTLHGGTGTDTLVGLGDNDTYLFNLGDGHDTINDRWGSVGDQLVFGAGIKASDIVVSQDANSLGNILLTINANDSVLLWLGTEYSNIIETFRFADGTTLTYGQMLAKLFAAAQPTDDIIAGSYFADTLLGGAGDDTLYGNADNDTLHGGAGNDLLIGYGEDDTYLFNLGDGHDTINDRWGSVGDQLVFGAGIKASDIMVSEDANNIGNILLTINANDSVLLWLGTEYSNIIETFRFADGTVLTYEQMLAKLFAAAQPTDDIFYGSYFADTLLGGAGDDTLYGNYGNDALHGGAGNDLLIGYGDDDTYLFNLGDGHDTISDRWGSVGDRLLFGDGIAASNIVVSLDTNNMANLKLSISENDTILLESFTNTPIELFQFADGTSWTSEDVLRMAGNSDPLHYQPSSTYGDDTLIGTTTSDTLSGAAGNDSLRGGTGSDKYLYELGDGHDTIYDASAPGKDIDRVVFGKGIKPGDVAVTASPSDPNDLMLVIGKDGGSLYLDGQLAGHAIERVEFDDGTIWLANAAGMIIPKVDAQFGRLLMGTVNGEILVSTAGNDTLRGGGGSDEYHYARGNGSDVIADGGTDGTDSLVLDGVNPSDITLEADRANAAMILHIGASTIRLEHQLDGSGEGIERIVFANDVTWTQQDMEQILLAKAGTPGNDRIEGFITANTLNGGMGNDVLLGGAGSDSYVFNVNEGNDTIVEQGYGSDNDTIVFASGITPSRVLVGHNDETPGDLTFTFVDAQGSITVQNMLAANGAGIENILFADGTSWDQGAIMKAYFEHATTPGNDTVLGFNTNDTITGLGGNDVLRGQGGNDTLDGGLGSDLLDGGAGDDILLYSPDAVWPVEFTAWNVGSPGAVVDGARVVVNPRFRSHDGFDGGVGHDILVMGDGDEALFLEDPYSDNPLGANIAKFRNIEEIQAGAGNDIIDLTSKNFSYGHVALIGGSGNDVLWSSAGNDIIDGGSGNDNIAGGLGMDILIGGQGSDIFVFNASHTGKGADADHITDFSSAEGDKISLLGFGVSAQGFVGAANFSTAAASFGYAFGTDANGGDNTLIRIDTNHDGKTDHEILLDNGHVLLHANDFIFA